MKSMKDTEAKSCHFVKIIDLKPFIQAIYDRGEMADHTRFNNEVSDSDSFSHVIRVAIV